jgi:hypothetical protein
MSTPRLGISSLLLGFLVACTAPPADPGTTPQGTAEKGTAREAAAAAEPADLVLRNGKIVTADDKIGTVEALAARDDRIVQVGTNVEIAKYVGDSTKVIDLKGKLAIPGFIEGHGHFTGLGRAKQVLDLMDVRNWDEIVAMVADAVSKAQPGEWITGRGWHQEKWDRVPANGVEGFPHHNTLSAVSPDNPVALTHASGHASFYNKKAMDLSGITKNTKDPRGGEIIRDANGEPIGVFRERAQGLVSRGRTGRGIRRSPEERREALRKTIQLADQECLANGVTSLRRCRIRDHQHVQGDGRPGTDRHPPLDHDPGQQRGSRRQPGQVPNGGLRQQPSDRAGDQGEHRRRPRPARRLDAGTLQGPAEQHGPQHGAAFEPGRNCPRGNAA